jgi:hypothetical protein
MYTRSDLALYRISIVNLPFPVKDVNGYGDYNIFFDSEKDFDFFLLIVSALARLVKVKDFTLARTAVLSWYRMTACYYVYDLFRACASFGRAFESVRIDSNVRLSWPGSLFMSSLPLGNKITARNKHPITDKNTGGI